MEPEKLRSLDVQVDDTRVSATVNCPKCGLELTLGTRVCPADGTALAPELTMGSQFAGKYTLEKLLGQGGMSAVYKATETVLNRTVAIKLMHQFLARDSVALKRFTQEARMVCQMNHPGVVRVYEFGVLDHGQPFIVMDFVEGESLAERLKLRGALTSNQTLDVFRQICEALDHAHQHGILHRDLKPSNVMLTRTEPGQPHLHATLVDFGIAKTTASDEAGHLTATGEVVGSPTYMSPEQARGVAVDARSDLYSLGCLIYEAISGKPVVTGANPLEVLYNKLNAEPAPLKEVLPDVSPALDGVVAKLLETDPDRRYQNAQSVLDDLNHLELVPWQARDAERTKSRKLAAMKAKPGRVRRDLVLLVLVGVLAGVASSFMMRNALVPAPVAQPVVTPSTESKTDDSLKRNLQKLSGVTTLSYDNTDITDAGVRMLANLRTLTTLKLNGTQVKYINPLGVLRNLQDLELGSSRVDDQSLKALANLPLKRLVIRDDTIIDGMRSVSQIRTLEYLDVSGTSITAGGAQLLTTMPNLHTLLIDRVRIGDPFAQQLPADPPEYLSMNGTLLTNNGLESITTRLRNLKGIALGDLGLDKSSVDLVCSVKGLKQVYLNRRTVDDGTIRKMASLPLLEDLGLDLGTLSKSGVDAIRSMTHLKRLQLNYDHMDDSVMPTIATAKNLQRLSLAGNEITDDGLLQIKEMQSLKDLDISDTRVSGIGLLKLQLPKNLEHISMRHITITPLQLSSFSSRYPSCHIDR